MKVTLYTFFLTIVGYLVIAYVTNEFDVTAWSMRMRGLIIFPTGLAVMWWLISEVLADAAAKEFVQATDESKRLRASITDQLPDIKAVANQQPRISGESV